MAPAIGRHHAEWLSLVETSGPFLSVPVLARALPQGLEPPDPDVTTRLRAAREQLADDPALHRSWCEFVLREVLELDGTTATGSQIPAGLEYRAREHGGTVRPDLVVLDHGGGAPQPLLHVTIHAEGQRPDRRLSDAPWSASPIDRMAALCRATGVPLGLVTNGRSWTLVWARAGEATGVCTWNAELWLEEPLTLRAFRTLLGAPRFFSGAADETLPALLEQSARNQQEVTDRLGAQVREAVELIIDALDRADRDRRGELLGAIENHELYRAAVTVMMRLVFLFVAEERRLLPLDDPLYAESYAASTLREQLEEHATRHGEDPLERSSAAWYRLLALSRAVHGGIEHEALRLPAYGGGLFDPDRYPFLEGRRAAAEEHGGAAVPLPVDDRTVLHLLTALQVLTEPGRAGQPPTSVRLSFRALDVEQIGHVYEGLLDHTAVRTFDAALGVVGPTAEEVTLGALEELRARGEDVLAEHLHKLKVRSTAAGVAKAMAATPDPDRVARLLAVCDNDPELRDRILPFLGLVRDDLRGDPRVFLPGALYVTKALERRSSGTYYTPRSLAEEVVKHALDPVCYAPGPAEGAESEEWRLRPVSALLGLKVADIAMGSGAFLVAACRYLAARVLESWEGDGVRDGESVPADPLEREVLAHRLVAERCLYGVDKNPMAVEMAKLSLWLVTLARERPFSFLDHALREGDSLLGVTDLEQVRCLHMDPARGRKLHGTLIGHTRAIGPALERALALREELESFAVRDIRDARRKGELNEEATAVLDDVRLLADVVVSAALANGNSEELDTALASVEAQVAPLLEPEADEGDRALARQALIDASQRWLQAGRVDVSVDRRCFHWALELPEVRAHGGFDAAISNPPFQGAKRISPALGDVYREYLVTWLADRRRGNADLVSYFVLRAEALLQLDGMAGLLATNTIGQGDTREVALDHLLDSGDALARAVRSESWPGGGNLEVAHLWLRRGRWDGRAVLDGLPVAGITSALEPRSRARGRPLRLAATHGRSFQGSIVLGMGFVLTGEEAQRLLAADPRSATIVKPYLNGEDLNSSPDCSPSRWVIDFGERDEDDAKSYPGCWSLLEQRVKPERVTKDPHKYPRMVYEWWKFWNARPGMIKAIAALDRVLILTRHTKVVQPLFVPTGWVYSDATAIFAYDDDAHFALLSSGFHWWWAVMRASTMRTDVRYTPTDCFETFSQPALTEAVATAGGALDAHRRELMLDRQEGLTKTYNRVHSPEEHAADIVRLRELHVALDYAVRDAYGWTDLDLGHDFHETRQGVRYTFESVVRQEILDRLLELNLERRAAEETAGLHAKKKGSSRRRAPRAAGQTDMLGR